MNVPRVTVVVPSWNTRELLARCLESVISTAEQGDCEIVVVDNASSDGSAELARDFHSSVRLIANVQNVGFARACNQAIAASRAPYLLFLNSDARLLPGTLRALLELAALHPRCGAAGVQVRDGSGGFQASHARFPSWPQELLVLSGLGRLLYGSTYPSHGPDDALGAQPVEWVSGACLFARRTALDEVGGFDEAYFMYGEEMDLCYRLRRSGWQVWYEPTARAVHLGGGSSSHRSIEREADLYCGRVRFFRRHYGTRAAAMLTALIYGFTGLKLAWHTALRRLSGGRRGRPVVPLQLLAARLSARR
jgi:GT2 family glycosyltransferase